MTYIKLTHRVFTILFTKAPQYVPRQYDETCEIIDIYSLWQSRIDLFRFKFRGFKVVVGGPLREEERSTWRREQEKPRQKRGFCILLSWQAYRCGHSKKRLALTVFAFRSEPGGKGRYHYSTLAIGPVDIQCAGAQSWRAFDSRVKEARRQISKQEQAWYRGYGLFGRTEISQETLLRTDSAAEAHKRIALLLNH